MEIGYAQVQAVVAGDPEAEDAFVQACRPLILALAHSRFSFSKEEAEEIVQTVMVGLFDRDRRALAAWRGEGKFSTYLTVITTRACLKYRSLHRPERPLAGPEPRATGASPVQRLETRERLASLAEGIARLRPRDQLLLRLRYQDGLEPSEIASMLSLKPGTARKALHDALKRLRKALSAEGSELFSGTDGNEARSGRSNFPRRKG